MFDVFSLHATKMQDLNPATIAEFKNHLCRDEFKALEATIDNGRVFSQHMPGGVGELSSFVVGWLHVHFTNALLGRTVCLQVDARNATH